MRINLFRTEPIKVILLSNIDAENSQYNRWTKPDIL
jgi:hypothetical protein